MQNTLGNQRSNITKTIFYSQVFFFEPLKDSTSFIYNCIVKRKSILHWN